MRLVRVVPTSLWDSDSSYAESYFTDDEHYIENGIQNPKTPTNLQNTPSNTRLHWMPRVRLSARRALSIYVS